MLAIFSPSDERMSARFLLSASAYKIIDFWIFEGGSISFISYLSAEMPHSAASF